MRLSLLFLAGLLAAQDAPRRPDGLYAEIKTGKGLIVARLEMDLVPMTVANFVGLSEGTIANAAFDLGRPFYDGTVIHRVEAGHVIQTGAPQSDRARNPGYTFPNEIHARLSHDHAGALNMANGGPNTSASQWCITLGDRSYLDGDYNVFGDVVQGLDVVMRIEKGDVVESVRIVRVGARAQAFHPTTDSFRAMVEAAQKRVAEHVEKKRAAEREWIAKNVSESPLAQVTDRKQRWSEPLRVRYRGREVRYMGHVIGRDGPPLDIIQFASGANGVPGFNDPPQEFTFEPGKTKLNSGLDAAIAEMAPGELRTVVVTADRGYGRAGLYPPEIKGKRRFAISPDALLVYDVETLAAGAHQVALTFDDLPTHGPLPPGVTRVDVARSIVKTLHDAKSAPVYGFVNAKKLEDTPADAEVLKVWTTAGFPLGSHAWSHMDLRKNSTAEFEKDIAANEPALRQFMPTGDWRWFRYPYLHEGDTLETKRAVAGYLKEHGYRVAEVTLSFEDYMFNPPYARCAERKDAAGIEQLKSLYVTVARDSLRSGPELARKIWGRDVKQIMLLHIGAFQTVMLPRLMELLREEGYTTIPVDEAAADPVYREEPAHPIVWNGTFLEQMLRSKNLGDVEMPAVLSKLDSICR